MSWPLETWSEPARSMRIRAPRSSAPSWNSSRGSVGDGTRTL
jgi:hypothetical protein